ncbi:MAG: hypothetical protein GQ570_08675 [Helicobacteraceae bacterium]|nr:hypothetical protein [Helicobacteraceae bacterium]
MYQNRKRTKKRHGIVLFVTLALLMVLTAIVTNFLEKQSKIKEYRINETAKINNIQILSGMVSFLKGLQLDEEMIFYGSKIPVNLFLSNQEILVTFNSSQYGININSLIKAMKEKPVVYDLLLEYFRQKELKYPEFFINLLQDTIDKDSFGINTDETEIILTQPNFHNGTIKNRTHLNEIINYYFLAKSDANIYKVEFEKMFTFDTNFIDINLASQEVIDFIFYDADNFTKKEIFEKEEIFEKLDELPFDDNYKNKIKKGVLGQNITVHSTAIKLNIKVQDKEFSFNYTLGKNSSVYNIEIY